MFFNNIASFTVTIWLICLNSMLSTLTDESFFKLWRYKYMAASGNKSPPKFYKEWILLAREMGCSEDPFDYKQVFSDLKRFKNQNLSISSVIQKYIQIRYAGPYVEIRNMQGLVELSNSHDWAFKNSLILVHRFLDPDIDFAFITHKYDESIVAISDDSSNVVYSSMKDVLNRSNRVRSQLEKYLNTCMLLQTPKSFVSVPFDAPVFGANRLRGYSDIILPTTGNGLPVYEKYIDTALNSPPWNEKENRAVFRGRTTGINFTKARLENIPLTNNPRFKLHEMSMQQKSGQLNCSVNLDFGLTDFWQFDGSPEYKREILIKYPLVKSLDYETQFKSKYQVIVDGNAWPDRVALYLLSGSVVFLSTLHEEWVINQLVEGEHYIKIEPDLSDLVEKLEWASNNDRIAERIAQNGRKFAKKKFNINQMQIYNAFLFMEYQKLFENNS